MLLIYTTEIEFAKKIHANSDKLNYFTSILRSILQTAAISSFEMAKEMTPSIHDDSSIEHLLDRFSQPSDGLPIEALDVLIPIIRSHVSKTYMNGWFEKTKSNNKTLAQDLLSWIEFRNNKPAHGVMDQNDVLTWSKKLEEITPRCLQVFSAALPIRKIEKTLCLDSGNSSLTMRTPLIQNDQAIVIRKVSARKGVWKMHAQSLSWISSIELTIDLGENSIFTPFDKLAQNKFQLRDISFPLSIKSVFNNIPIRQTNTFVGRSKELKKLETWINEIEYSHFCLVYGDGGFGKTTLTLEFLNRLLEGNIDQPKHLPTLISYYTAKKTKWTDNGLIHFKGISDAMEDSIRELLYFLYPVLGKEWYKIQGISLIDKIAGEFAEQGLKRDDILLILDNTETLATSPKEVEDLSEFLEMVGKKIGRVIITSRRREVLPAVSLPISALTDDEAADLMSRLGREYTATAVIQAGEARLRSVCKKLSNKPLLIDTLVKYISRSSSGLQNGLDQILRKTSDELLEFLYQDAWLRMNEMQREVFLVLVNLVNPIDKNCVGDACQNVGIQHIEFQSSLDETYFATLTDYGDNYDLEIVDLAKEFFRQQLKKCSPEDIDRINSFTSKADEKAYTRQQVDREYKLDRVADGFRSQYAKAAKIATFKGDLPLAKDNFELALLDEPLNAALRDRYALFLLHRMQRASDAKPVAEEAVDLDPKNADASLTLALIHYQLGDLKAGDDSIELARKKGKSESLCYLRKAIARYHKAKQAPYSKDTMQYLKQAELFIENSLKTGDSIDFYYYKNTHEAKKYSEMIMNLRSKIHHRNI